MALETDKPQHADANFVCVVAIDFGTTYSGYAFSLKSAPDNVRSYVKWGECVSIPFSAKTPTVLLTDKEDNFVALGYEALMLYSEMSPEESKEHRLYREFKMMLHDVKNLRASTLIRDSQGFECQALTAFALVIKALKDHAMKNLKLFTDCILVEEQVRWVLTIPAIWNDAAKQFMKEAAVQAGLAERTESRNLVLALEPEAATLFCQKLPVDALPSLDGRPQAIAAGDKILVIDAGGGTVDITSHVVTQDNRLEEICVSNGLPVGGARINTEILKLMEKILGEKFVADYQKANMADFTQFMWSLETKKRSFHTNLTKKTVIPMTMGLASHFPLHYKKDLMKSVTDEFIKRKCSVTNGLLRIPNDVMMEAFTPVVDSIVDHIQKLLKLQELRSITKIILVGGLSDCEVLREAIMKQFGGTYNVLAPTEGWSAVVKGAVLYGHRPEVIHTRRARRTYGKSTCTEFDPTEHDHDLHKCEFVDGELYAKDVFSVFVRKGDTVNYDALVEKIYYPLSRDQQALSVDLYATQGRSPRYVIDRGVSRIGKLVLNLPGEGLDRAVNVMMEFGGTEIKVEARDARDKGEVVTTKLDFL